MGVVYRAYDSTLRRRVALKVIRADASSAHGDGSLRMLREARAAAALAHPNVVTIFDVGEHEGTPFIAMELLKGAPLRALLASLDVTLEQKLAWVLQIARALAAAHDAGLVHRDSKPDNVMVLESGAIKVLDFGVARVENTDPSPAAPHDGTPSSFRTAPDRVIGTPRYMAPEQVMGGALDGRVDQFAWGLVAYELLARREAREVEPAFSQLTAWSKPARPLAEVAPGVRPAVSAVVMRAIEHDRERRFASMHDVEEALVAAAPELAVPRERASIVPRADVAFAPTVTEAAVASTRPLDGAKAPASKPADAEPASLPSLRGWTRIAPFVVVVVVALFAVGLWRLGASRGTPPRPVRPLDDAAKLLAPDPPLAMYGLAATPDGGALLAGSVAISDDDQETAYAAAAWLHTGGRVFRVRAKLPMIASTVSQPVILAGEAHVVAVSTNMNESGAFAVIVPAAPGTTDAGPFGGARSVKRVARGARWVFAGAGGKAIFAAVDFLAPPAGRSDNVLGEQIQSFVYVPGEPIETSLLVEHGALVNFASTEGRGAALVERDDVLSVVFFDVTSRPLGAPVVLGKTHAAGGAIAFLGTKLVAIWSDTGPSGLPRWTLVTLDGATVSPPIAVEDSDGAEGPALATADGRLYGLWIHRTAGGTELRWAATTDPSKLARAAITLRAAPGMFGPVLSVSGTSRWGGWREGDKRTVLTARLPEP